MPDSSISKFFEKSRKERLNTIAAFANLSKDELDILENTDGGISFDKADKMIENAIGTFSLPLGVATNFQINGKDYVVPMVIEEPSVIAAASKGAKIVSKENWGLKKLAYPIQNKKSGFYHLFQYSVESNVISKLASSYIDGLKSSGMSSIGKHFPGHGGVILDSHIEMPIDDRGMNELINDIKPYVYLMNKHLDAIMTAHIHYPLIDESITTFSKHWLKTILRQELGFNGLIFSDDLMMKAVNTELNMDEKINHALSAECDFVLVCNMESQMSDLLDDLDLNINESEMSAKINTLRCKSINKGMIKHSFRELTLKLNHLLDSL
mgnify:CR=1 FL=1